MNNCLQLCRILLLQIHGKLKPISISSTSRRGFSRSCSCSPALLEVPWVAQPMLRALGDTCPGLDSLEPSSRGASGQVKCRSAAAALASAGKQGLGGAAVKVGAGLGVGSLGQHQRVGVGKGMQGVLNRRARWGCGLRVALSRWGHKSVPFASAEAIKRTERANPECLSAFGWVYTGADM